jgi:hypothetical protein
VNSSGVSARFRTKKDRIFDLISPTIFAAAGSTRYRAEMSALVDLLMGIFRQKTLGGAAMELAALAAPLWVAALVGLLVGWAWRPRWAGVVVGDNANAAHQAALVPVPQATAVVPR